MITSLDNNISNNSCHCDQRPQEIVITAGGLSEPIDNVRAITNKSTGALGAIIAGVALNAGHIVHYVHSATSIMPSNFDDKCNRNLHLYEVSTARELLGLLQSPKFKDVATRIDKFVHAMAVSDFEISAITPSRVNGKISSDAPEVKITLRPTPKVISYLRPLFQNAKIFGFKLLSGVEVSELLDVAYALGKKNNCDFVVANRLEDIVDNRHEAYILPIDCSNSSKNLIDTKHCLTKSEIAHFIVNTINYNSNL